jgi:hypothetical protein
MVCFACITDQLDAQLTVSGTVFDSSRRSYVENVSVVSTGGKQTLTDSMGNYKIPVAENDSLTFIYNNKPTQTIFIIIFKICNICRNY